MSQQFCQLNGVPVWDAWGSATARTWHLHAPLTLTWQDGSEDVIAPTGNATARLLPEDVPAFDQAANEYVVVSYQGAQAANPLAAGPTVQLYLVRMSAKDSIESLLTAALAVAPGWAILRWIQRVKHDDWEQG